MIDESPQQNSLQEKRQKPIRARGGSPAQAEPPAFPKGARHHFE
jgi:hypothetical protein